MTPSTTDPLGRLVCAAAVSFTPPAARPGVSFRWTGAGVAVDAGPGRVGFVAAGGCWSPPAGLGTRLPLFVGPAAALAALLGCALRAGRRVDGPVVLSVAAVLADPPPARPDQWLGFRRVHGGWVGLVTAGDAQRELAEFGLADVRSRGLDPTRSACRLQSLGLAALPARPTPPLSTVDQPESTVEQTTEWQPLRGRRVLGLGRLVAAPFAADLLASLGATVVRVRAPGDPLPGEVLDLGTAAARDRLDTLVATTDLVLENYRPRAWHQLVPAATRARVTRHTAVRGFPSDSPCANWRVFGFLAEAACGVGPVPAAGATGRIEAPRLPLWDRVTGVVAAAEAITLLGQPRGASETSLVGLARRLRRATRGGDA